MLHGQDRFGPVEDLHDAMALVFEVPAHEVVEVSLIFRHDDGCHVFLTRVRLRPVSGCRLVVAYCGPVTRW
jgi:hypothetical protein